ncbi:MAG: hypothetical protein JO370_09390 [Paucibacter sp.]|nr:hypothetical protein [Roseateles sp.]
MGQVLPEFQRRVLFLLEDAVHAGEASPVKQAYLADRVAIHDGQPSNTAPS